MEHEALRVAANKYMQSLSGRKRYVFDKRFIEDAYPSDEPFGSLSLLEADAEKYGLKIVPTMVSGTEVYIALFP
jgi:hypothetical protein